MARPRDLGVIDLMLEVPSGEAGMGMGAACQLTRDKGTDDFTHHPAQYLFKSAPERMSKTTTVDRIVEMMNAFGVQMAQIGVSARNPEPALQMFDKYPTRFFGSVGVDPHAGMEGVRALEDTVKRHPNIKSASAAPCLLYPQVPIDDKRFYPVYAKCAELGIPINMLVGVPGPRVPFKWPNLYYSTSAWAPKHYPRNVLEFANKRGPTKVMYAGYFPGLSYERIFGEMDDLPLGDEVWPRFLRDNAVEVYGLQDILP